MKKESALKSILCFAFALFFPVILAVGITDNTNETMPLLYWVLCPALMFAAAMVVISGPIKYDGKYTDKAKWVGVSTLIGLVEAAMLTLMV